MPKFATAQQFNGQRVSLGSIAIVWPLGENSPTSGICSGFEMDERGDDLPIWTEQRRGGGVGYRFRSFDSDLQPGEWTWPPPVSP